MSNTNNVIVSISYLEQFRYFMAHQPPFLGLVLAYAAACLLLYWVTRGTGYLISLFAGFCYLIPYITH